MPRSRVPPTLLTKLRHPREATDGPRLWNAKRRIKTSKGLDPEQFRQFKKTPPHVWYNSYVNTQQDPSRTGNPSIPKFATAELYAIDRTVNDKGELEWWKLDREHLDKFMDLHPQLCNVSPDVRTFISDNAHNLTRSKILSLLRNPVQYFSASSNVPLQQRKQIYFPDVKDAVVLMRTPHLGPRYAAFDVPLHFSKLDMKAYLKNVYNVDVLHIRSVVIQGKVQRKDAASPYTRGELFRPPSQKKMTVQLAKPFVYPEEIKDLSPWEHDPYWNTMKAMLTEQRRESQWGTMNPNIEHRKSIAQQAQELLRGKAKWAPTWQAFADNARAMQGVATKVPASPLVKNTAKPSVSVK
ncbi:hypothetical protein ABEF92_000763 [Exophiala dermatitidis]|uniref:Large ribosomal subunit protein uL23m n=1 Tax=Exophiala dermatitidis (strain ATCC 34100 / CBS 525.76 / NIH/UT8656) TaxID=858893 RepID=H6BLM7_EXODN|nr:uncharacterized protein HMPREF1120_01072 [Exophiala dermatitidis NIH/UT8656]EHY52866.1 hypothetical protein HMPREF1120_01072 [Exophiala dermatitidis NIH/UT8656]